MKRGAGDINFLAVLPRANLTHSNMSGADLTNTAMDCALWTDSSVCQACSVGECKK